MQFHWVQICVWPLIHMSPFSQKKELPTAVLLLLVSYSSGTSFVIQWSPYIRPPSPAATPFMRPDLTGTDGFLSIFTPHQRPPL